MNIRLPIVLLALIASYQPAEASSFGRTVGQFDVSHSGSAQYSIPIWTPPGIRGIQPNLTITYDSHLSYGFMGPGWTLTGLSAITRCNPTYAQDGTPAPLTLTLSDRFCLDGNRLRLTSSENLSTYGEAGTTYQTEIANFSNVTANGTAGNGPSNFTVQGKDGLTYEYGNTTDSKIIPSGGSTPYVWALDKVTDRAGNHMTFTYYQQAGSYVPLSIQYTAPSGSSTFPYQINFTYTAKSANDTLSKFIAASQIQQTEQLSTITVTSSGSTVREYKLLYTTSTDTLRATLTSIQECGGSGGADCLAATTVGYQSGTAGVASPATASGSGATNGTVYSADFNGDGLQDLVFAITSGTNYQWWVQFATPTGYGAPINTGAVTAATSNFLIDTFDSTGVAEILAPVSGVWYLYKWNGTSFTATSTGVAVNSSVQYASADVDGDGRPDLISITPGSSPGQATEGIQLNTSSGSTVSFVATPVVNILTVNTVAIKGIHFYGSNKLPNSPVQHFDFDGDGRQDLLLQYFVITNGNVVYHATPLISRGTGAPLIQGGMATQNTTPGILEAVNWNDDVCTDLVFDTGIWISQCNGSVASYLTLPASPQLALDWDGDGRTDLLANVGGTWELYRSEGNAFAAGVSTGITVASGTYIVTDQNGDGLNDLVFINSGASNAIYYGLHNGAGQAPDLANSFKDGYGNFANPYYVSIAQNNYTETSDATFPYQDYIGPMYIVHEVLFSDPSNMPSETYTQGFLYAGAWTNLQGRGFQSFLSRATIDSRTALYEYQYYERSFPYTGLMYEDVWGNGSVYPSISEGNPAMLTLDNTANNERYFPYFNGVTTNEVEVGGSENGDQITTTVRTYNYDNYGNATTVGMTVTDTDPNSPYLNDVWSSTTVRTIAPDTSTWCLSLPTETQVTNSSTAPGGTSITRTVTYTPDYTNCRQTQRVFEPNSALYKVTEDFYYDGFGNLFTDDVTGVGMAMRTTTTSWGTNGQFLSSITNPLGQAITLTHDPNSGMLTSATDPNYTTANPLMTSWGYDDFARVTSETRPDGTSTTWAYNSCATSCVNSNNQMTVTQTNVGGTSQAVTNTYLDSLDRPLVTSSTMLTGAYDRNEIQYDSLGRLAQQGAPCTFVSCTNYWTSYTYDVLNRPIKMQRPISSTNSNLLTTSIGYQGRVTTLTDPNANTTTTITQVTGSLGRTQDPSGYYINFTYDAFGSLLSATDSLSNTLSTMTYAYGLGAFRLTFSDTDLGARTYTTDALGEVTSYSDAKGQNFSVIYDALSRPTSRTEPDLTTNWTWGATAASYNIGQLQSVSSTDSVGTRSESFGYDSKTRLSTDAITIPGDATYTYTLTYNGTTGLLDTLQYPVSTASYQMKLQYTYLYGILQKISDITSGGPGTQYWTANTMNPQGQILQETLGNGVVVNHTFDAVTGLVGTIQAGVGSGSTLQNNAYLFDYVGNLTQRQDYNSGVTESVYPDNLNRLSNTVGDTNTQMTYDAMGRIATWAAYGSTANVTDYTTPQSGCTYYANSQLHAVRKSTQGSWVASFCRDANGNMTTMNINGTPTYSAAWASFNQPTDLSGGTSSSQFFYDANHQRYKQLASYSGAAENTIYVGGLLEKMSNSSGTAYRHYIPAGNNTIVYTRLSSGTNSTFYMTKDHLGSTAVITDQTGTSLVKEEFSALGWNENTTAQQATMATVSRHEFTGHEGIDNAGLGMVNMNGRVYIPSGSMFISPDPYVPDPGDTQSFNRYGYVNNNPLTLTDPTGFDDSECADTEACASVLGHLWDLGTTAGGNFFTNLWGDVKSFFGFGGSPHLSAYQQKVSNAGLQSAQNLQGAPATVSSENGWRYDFPASTDVPQVTAIPEVTVTGQFMGPGPLTTPQPDLTLSVEPPSAIANFAAQTAQNLREIAAGQAQSANYPSEIASTPSYGAIVGQSMARSGPKAAMVGLTVAGFIPPIALEARVARGVIAARDAVGIGEFAGESIAARSAARDFTSAERAAINRIGSNTGCHTCGTRIPGTKSGNFVPDHQPASALNPVGGSQRLYPHCIDCSREQGLEIARQLQRQLGAP
jgi:RHS repeat-associated protein